MYLSVIIPVFNAEEYLSTCLSSILDQTFSDFELILVNDESQDRSLVICNDIAEQNFNFNIHIYSITHSGAAAARNYGLAKAKGEYIIFIDSDDWIEKNMFYKLVEPTFNKKYDSVSCDLLIEKNSNSIRESHSLKTGEFDREMITSIMFPKLLYSNTLKILWPYRMVTKIYNHGFLRKYDIKFVPDLKAAQDYAFSVTAMYFSNTFFYLKDEYLYHYRENLQSRTHRFLNDSWKNYNVLNEYFRLVLSGNRAYNFQNQLEICKLHGALSAISYQYKSGRTNKFWYNYKEIKQFVNRLDLNNSIHLIDLKNVEFKKRIYLVLMKHRCFFLCNLIAYIFYTTQNVRIIIKK